MRSLLPALVLLLAVPGALAAQSLIGGEVEGTVMDVQGVPVRGALVTLQGAEGGIGRTERTGTTGDFSYRYVPGGSYVLRVEALGFRPQVVTGVEVTPGDRLRIPVTIFEQAPPVTAADTVSWGGTGGGGGGSGLRLGPNEIEALPDRSRDVSELVAVSSFADAQGGLEGLPLGFTSLFVDGEPFHRAEHPSLSHTGVPVGLLFPRVGLQSATLRSGLEDIEWSGSAAGIVSLETRSGRGDPSGELFGLFSNGSTWTNEVVGEGPTLQSTWGGGAASLPLIRDTAVVALSAEAGLVETPNIFWRNDFFTDRVLPDSVGVGLRRTEYGAGSARFDWVLEEGTRITARAGFATFRKESERIGMPRSAYGADLPGEGTDGSFAAIFGRPFSDALLLEIRGSVGFSSRSWEDASDSLSGAWLVRDRARLGPNPSYAATSDRLDLSLAPVLHFQTGANRVKAGIRIDWSSFDMSHVEQSTGAYFFGSRGALQGGRGAAIGVPDEVPAVDFSMLRFSAFGQYRWSARPGLDITTGLGVKIDRLPLEEIQPNAEWALLTGIPNVVPDEELVAIDGRVHLRWDLRGDGRTWIVGGFGLEHSPFHPAAMHEVLTLDGPVEVSRAFGDSLDWRRGELPGGADTGVRLSLFAPDLEAPRTTRASFGLFQNLTAGLRLGVSAAFRRTEAILRRDDLNRLLEPVGTDQDGRPVFGDLDIVSGVLAADPATNRRFPGFESVWALSPDGWSEYTGITASLEAPLGRDGSVAVRYTWSETTDNWVGAAEGGALELLRPELPDDEWDEGTSDFDIPHRLSVLGVAPLPLPWGGRVTGIYTFRSDRPFTARVAAGLDANGDGSPFNDPAFVPENDPAIDELAADWDCLSERLGQFAERNGCRADGIHSLDVRVSVGLPPIGGLAATLTVDGLNLTDRDMGIRDDNLLLLGGGNVSSEGDAIEVPYRVNPGFGEWLFRGDTGRMLRVGFRLGADR